MRIEIWLHNAQRECCGGDSLCMYLTAEMCVCKKKNLAQCGPFTCDYIAGMQNIPGGKRYYGLASPFRRLEWLCYKQHTYQYCRIACKKMTEMNFIYICRMLHASHLNNAQFHTTNLARSFSGRIKSFQLPNMIFEGGWGGEHEHLRYYISCKTNTRQMHVYCAYDVICPQTITIEQCDSIHRAVLR